MKKALQKLYDNKYPIHMSFVAFAIVDGKLKACIWGVDIA
jgi:hypothetical protein